MQPVHVSLNIFTPCRHDRGGLLPTSTPEYVSHPITRLKDSEASHPFPRRSRQLMPRGGPVAVRAAHPSLQVP